VNQTEDWRPKTKAPLQPCTPATLPLSPSAPSVVPPTPSACPVQSYCTPTHQPSFPLFPSVKHQPATSPPQTHNSTHPAWRAKNIPAQGNALGIASPTKTSP